MIRKFIAILFVLIGAEVCLAGKLKVVDARDGEPLPCATVFSRSGIILGITDGEGELADVSDKDYPLTIRCLGYEPAVCDKDVPELRMKSTEYDLKEMVVTAADRPVIRVVCYIREYISGATEGDTVINFNEHMADFFLTPGKVKGFKPARSPRLLRSRLYARVADSSGHDSIYRPEFRRDDFAWEALIKYPNDNVLLTDVFKPGSNCDTVPGKSGAKLIRRLTPELYTLQHDYLSAFKDHSLSPWIFKVLGMTVDFDQLQSSWVYRNDDSGVVGPDDLLTGTFSMSVLGKGKWIKKTFHTDQPIRMYGFYEIYPVKVQHLTVEEAKRLKSSQPAVTMQVPPLAPPLPPALQQIVDGSRR